MFFEEEKSADEWHLELRFTLIAIDHRPEILEKFCTRAAVIEAGKWFKRGRGRRSPPHPRHRCWLAYWPISESLGRQCLRSGATCRVNRRYRPPMNGPRAVSGGRSCQFSATPVGECCHEPSHSATFAEEVFRCWRQDLAGRSVLADGAKRSSSA